MDTLQEPVQGMMPIAAAGVAPKVSHPGFRSALVHNIAIYMRETDPCEDDYAAIAHALWMLLAPAQREVLAQLVTQGPVWDADIVSKTARDFLLGLELASRACYKGWQGYTIANYRGYDVWKQGTTQ